jgi:hypothetical protein
MPSGVTTRVSRRKNCNAAAEKWASNANAFTVPRDALTATRTLVAPPPAALPRLLSRMAPSPLVGQGCSRPAGCPTASLRHDRPSPTRRRFASPLRTSRRLTVAHGANLPGRTRPWLGRCASTRRSRRTPRRRTSRSRFWSCVMATSTTRHRRLVSRGHTVHVDEMDHRRHESLRGYAHRPEGCYRAEPGNVFGLSRGP